MFTFDTGLSEDVFAKTRLVEHLTEKGLLAELGDDGVFAFKEWAFTSTQSNGETVVLCADDWGDSPVSLLELLDSNKRAVCVAINAMQSASKKPAAGAGGIYVSSDMKRVLFLPPALFDLSSSFRGAYEYHWRQGVWRCANDELNCAFIAASMAYCLLTGKPPYNNTNEVARDADIYDKNYLPLELAINGVNPELSSAVDAVLEAPSALLRANETGGAANSANNGAGMVSGGAHKGKNSGALAASYSLPIDALYTEVALSGDFDAARPGAISGDEFKARVDEYCRARDKRIRRSRTLRRNKAAITAAVIGAAAAAVAVFFAHRDAMDRPTMQGLTSREVTSVFYKAINEQDVAMVTASAHGKVSSEVGDGLSQVFVSGKMRSMYETGGIVTLEEWLIRNANGAVQNTFGVYGLTNVKIDGASAIHNIKVPLKKEHPAPVRLRDIDILEGSTASHIVRYYFVHTEGEEQDFFCEKHVDRVLLTYIKDKWRVTDVMQETEDLEVDSASFRADLKNAISADTSGKGNLAAVSNALSALKGKYVWLPETLQY